MYPSDRKARSCSGVSATLSDGVKSCPSAWCASNCASRNAVYFGRFPVRLRLVEAPLHRLRNVLGNLGAPDGRGVEVFFEVQGCLSCQGRRA